MNTTELTDYKEFLVARWQRLHHLSPVTPWERRLVEQARFSIWLEARRSGLTEQDLAEIEREEARDA